MEIERDPQLELGFLLSIVGHALIAYLFYYGIRWNSDFGAPKIYSITLEGGKSLGGISQVAKKDDKTPIAPPKNVEEKPKTEEIKKLDAPKEEKKIEEKKPQDAEISIKQKKEEKPKAEEKKPEPQKVTKPKESSRAEEDKRLQQAVQRYLGESTDAGGKGFGAGALGGKGMGGGIQMPPEFFAYQEVIKKTVKGGWRWYDTNAPLIATVTFSLSPSGEISNIQIVKRSGNYEFDESVERAVMKANPLPPPPVNVYEYFRLVRMTMDPRE